MWRAGGRWTPVRRSACCWSSSLIRCVKRGWVSGWGYGQVGVSGRVDGRGAVDPSEEVCLLLMKLLNQVGEKGVGGWGSGWVGGGVVVSPMGAGVVGRRRWGWRRIEGVCLTLGKLLLVFGCRL